MNVIIHSSPILFVAEKGLQRVLDPSDFCAMGIARIAGDEQLIRLLIVGYFACFDSFNCGAWGFDVNV
jgi:hypothetical protein